MCSSLLISVISGHSWLLLTSGTSKADTFIQPLQPQKRSDSFNGGMGLPIPTKWPLSICTRLELPPPFFFIRTIPAREVQKSRADVRAAGCKFGNVRRVKLQGSPHSQACW